MIQKEGNINSRPINKKVLKTLDNITHLFHLASPRINRCAQYNSEGHKTIADGGFNVVDYCAKNNVKLFFSSTASVYQKPKVFPIKEETNCNPHTIYGAGKLYTEHLIKSYENARWAALRGIKIVSISKFYKHVY